MRETHAVIMEIIVTQIKFQDVMGFLSLMDTEFIQRREMSALFEVYLI